jgi:hypothetical protein
MSKFSKISLIFLILFLSSCSWNFIEKDVSRTPSCINPTLACATSDKEYAAIVRADEEFYKNNKPHEWIDSQVKSFLEGTESLSNQAPDILSEEKEINIRAKRNPFRSLLYEHDLIEYGDRTLFMTDKLFMAKVWQEYLGDDFELYHLKTLGLKEYLSRNNLIDNNGKVIVSREKLKKLLELEFPNGLIAKPAIGMSSDGKGFYNNIDEIVDLIMKADGEIYSEDFVKKPFHWSHVKRFTSGEEFILQEKMDFGGDVGEKNAYAIMNEYRVHTFYDKVVEGATETRWESKNTVEMNNKVNAYVQRFLDSLPKEFTNRQAWGLDVFVLPNGKFKIIEANTNRGKAGNWSGYSYDSRNLGAHVRHIEKYFKWKFTGFSGFLFRNNLANLRPYIRNEAQFKWHKFLDNFTEKKKKLFSKFKTKQSNDFFKSRGCSGLLCISDEKYFKNDKAQRIGIEVELSGLSQEEIAKILQKEFGGRIEEKVVPVAYVDHTTGNRIQFEKKIVKLKRSKVGTLKIVPEFNEQSSADLDITKASAVEIITDPIEYDKVSLFQNGLDILKKKGAIGTNSVSPVSIQYNVEMLNSNSKEIMNILRNWYTPSNYKQIQKDLPLYENRLGYVGSYSPGFMNKIYDKNYNPTMQELFDDFFYRQIAEYLEYEDAWEDNIDDVKSYVKNNLQDKDFDKILKVFKWNDVRISSLLLHHLPNEWISEYLIESQWVKPVPLIEFRRPNNDFEVDKGTRSIVGFTQESKKRTFNFADELGKLHGIRGSDLEKVLSVDNPYEKPYIIRQFLGTPEETAKNAEFAEFLDLVPKYERRSIPLWIDTQRAGAQPYLLPGESVVFHRLPDTASNIIGKYNPALINGEISKILDHKYIEFAFWNKYAPNTMAKTGILSDLSKSKSDAQKLKETLDKEYSNGWVIKGIWDTATQKEYLITDETDLEAELKKYKDNYQEFIDFREELKKETAASNPDLFTRKLRERKEFTGYRINRFLKKPDQFIVQEKLIIKEEYRVEVIAGKVLRNGSTIPRYQYEYPDSDEYLNDPNIKKVEDFAQAAVDQLPEELRYMTFGTDIALLEDGSVKMIESNPQGNSGFLAYDKRSVKALDKFLQSYPDLVKEGKINQGLTAEQQINWIRNFVEDDLKLDLDQQYPHLEFLKASIVNRTASGNSCATALLPFIKLYK